MKYFEVNFDGIVGPTHNYAGLAQGNLASRSNKFTVSNPRAAALQGLAKMSLLHSLGVRQAVIPPQPVPHMDFLKTIGFHGHDKTILEEIVTLQPKLLSMVYSSSSMWTANCAITTSSLDSSDGKVHFTPANLISNLHRSLEVPFTMKVLKSIFSNQDFFQFHDPVPVVFPDEGSANVVRLCHAPDREGMHLMVYGREVLGSAEDNNEFSFFSARQSLEAFEVIIRNHGLNFQNVLAVRQRRDAIKAGVFHNDVISFGNRNVFIYHEAAFEDSATVVSGAESFFKRKGDVFYPVKITYDQLSLEESVKTYFFNSQLVSITDKEMALISPAQCAENSKTSWIIKNILAHDNPVQEVHYVNLDESMKNGGGPACLRMKVWLNEAQWENINPAFKFTSLLHDKLEKWIYQHYREKLYPEDLGDYGFLLESRSALESLEDILGVSNLYEFP